MTKQTKTKPATAKTPIDSALRLKKGNLPATLDDALDPKHPARVAGEILVHRDDLSKQFDNMKADEWPSFLANVRERGIRVPTILYTVTDSQVFIVDGWNRCRAAAETGKADQLEFVLADESAQAEVISLNLHRRHLNTSQKTALALKYLTSARGYTQKDAAARMGVSVRNIKLGQQALNKCETAEERLEVTRKWLRGEESINATNAAKGGTQTGKGKGQGGGKAATPRVPRVPTGATSTPAKELKLDTSTPPKPATKDEKITEHRDLAVEAIKELVALKAYDALRHVATAAADQLFKQGVPDHHALTMAERIGTQIQKRVEAQTDKVKRAQAKSKSRAKAAQAAATA